MKRYLFLFVVLIMTLVLLMSCGETPTTSAETPDTSTTTDGSSAEQTTAITDTTDTADNLDTTETTEAPGTTLDTLGEEKRAELVALVAANKEKAFTIGDSTIAKYGKAGVIISRYYNPTTKKVNGTASVWHYTAYYSMISRLVDIAEDGSSKETDYNDRSDRVYDGFQYYAGTGNIITYLGTVRTTLYGVNRSKTKGGGNIEGDQMVYDDQMWIIREFVYRYKQTGDKKYLDEAIRLAGVCIKGWDYTLDENKNEYGGIPWGPFYATKHTCSNAPIVAPLVEIYEILKEQGNGAADYYLEWAEKIYNYVKKNLRAGNKCYDDLIGYTRSEGTMSNGQKYYYTTGLGGYDGKQYSYNTGAMISGGIALYRATGRSSFLTETKQTAVAAYNVFCKKDKTTGTPYYPNTSETTWFNMILFQGFLDYYEYDKVNGEKMIMSFQKSLDYAYDNYAKDGLLPRDFVSGWNTDSNFDKDSNVMDHSSYAQTYAMLAMWAEKILAEDDAKLAGNGLE